MAFGRNHCFTAAIPFTSDTALTASKTQFFNPETVTWDVSQNGAVCGSGCASAGTSTNPIYVTLAPNVMPAGAQPLMLTYVSLAVVSGGATSATAAISTTWQQFSTGSGPANVKTWDGRSMFYYAPRVGFESCATSSEPLVEGNGVITGNTVSGQCGAFEWLLESVLAANGIYSNYIDVAATDGSLMVTDTWTLSGTPTFPSQAPWEYKLLLNVGDYMVPLPSAFGDLGYATGIAGQGNAQPSEKVFNSHYIVQIPSASGNQYYDPSYGVTYPSAAGFELQSVQGYAKSIGDPAGQYHFRKAISPPLAPNITFTVNTSFSM